MDQSEFIDHLRSLYDRNVSLARAKNHDYAASHDPFWNLRLCEYFGLCSVEVGILVRLLDKIGRIVNLINFAPAVRDETIHDTIGDAQNYLGFLDAHIKNQEQAELADEDERNRWRAAGFPAGPDEEDAVLSYFDPQLQTPDRKEDS